MILFRVWEFICTNEFLKKLKLHEPLRRVQFQLSEKFESANSKLTRKTVWLLINNIDMTKKNRVKEVSEYHIGERKRAFDADLTIYLLIGWWNFRYHFTWYHWVRKFPIVFQPIIIQCNTSAKSLIPVQITHRNSSCWCTEQKRKRSFGYLTLLLCKTWDIICYCFVQQHGSLITWLKIIYIFAKEILVLPASMRKWNANIWCIN